MNINIFTLDLSKKCASLKIGIKKKLYFPLRNGDEITSPSRRIDLGQICSISNHKS
jgi:hypothetical protein